MFFCCFTFAQVSGAAVQSVTLAWDPSTSPDVAGYNIYYGMASGSYPTKIPAGNSTSTTISGLVPGTTYYFVATAYNSLGLESDPSNELPYTVPAAPAGSSNQPPTLNAIANLAVNQNAGLQSINLSGITSGATNENQNLTITATSSAPGIVPNPTINYTSPNANGTLSFTPVANASGSATITVTVNDGQSQNNLFTRSFTVTINPVSLPQPVPTLASQSVPVSGNYSGLFYEDNGVQQNSSGYLTLTMSAKGSYSGKIQIGSGRFAFSGKVTSTGPITNIVARKGTSSLTLVLWTDVSNSSNQISGQITDGTWVAKASGDRAIFNSKTSPAPFAGSYTLVIPQDQNQPLPMGYGFGTLKVTATGAATFTGTLADGTSISQAATISGDGMWPLYVPLYAGKGSTISWIGFTNQQSSDLSGLLNWINPSNPKAKYYSNGFTNVCTAIGSGYAPPVGKTSLTSSFNNVNLNGVDINIATSSTTKTKLTISSKTGTFKGSVTDSTTKKATAFSGALFPKMNSGYGFALDTDKTSKPAMITP